MEAREIVPPEVLVPPEAYSRGLHHDEAALVLDGWLRRLAAQDSRCRAVLGRLAHGPRPCLGHRPGRDRLGTRRPRRTSAPSPARRRPVCEL